MKNLIEKANKTSTSALANERNANVPKQIC
jgi:hypothetical protein